MKRLKQIYAAATTALALPLLTFADLVKPYPVGGLPGDPGRTLGTEIVFYIRAFLAIVGLLAVVYLIYGGFRYITAGGDEEAVESAKRIIKNAIIGLIVIILSFVIINVIINAIAEKRVG